MIKTDLDTEIAKEVARRIEAAQKDDAAWRMMEDLFRENGIYLYAHALVYVLQFENSNRREHGSYAEMFRIALNELLKRAAEGTLKYASQS